MPMKNTAAGTAPGPVNNEDCRSDDDKDDADKDDVDNDEADNDEAADKFQKPRYAPHRLFWAPLYVHSNHF